MDKMLAYVAAVAARQLAEKFQGIFAPEFAHGRFLPYVPRVSQKKRRLLERRRG